MWLSQNKGVVSAKYILLRPLHLFMVQALKLVGGFAPLKIPGSSSYTQREVLLYPLPSTWHKNRIFHFILLFLPLHLECKYLPK